MFKDARKQAGLSINVAALELHIGPRTLVNYENSHTTIPPEAVLNMADVYDQPVLVARFCAEQCPIGQVYAHSPKEKCLTENILTLLKELNDIKNDKNRIIEIASDGIIDRDEKHCWDRIMKNLDELAQVIDQIKWWARAQQKQKPAPAMIAKEQAPYGQKEKAACVAAR